MTGGSGVYHRECDLEYADRLGKIPGGFLFARNPKKEGILMFQEAWKGFMQGQWQTSVNVRDFIQKNYTPYLGDESFLSGPSVRTQRLWDTCKELIAKEMKEGVLDVETKIVSGINQFAPGYVDRENEVIVGLQTDAPLKRIINPYGGIRMVKEALGAYGYELDAELLKVFTHYRKTHNQGVFDAYTQEIKEFRSAGLLTGLPDAYGRGRIIGDYRRIPLYGTDFLVFCKEKDLENLTGPMGEEVIRLREEVREQIRALDAMKEMARQYGIDISKPATNAREAVQFLYFAYLAGVKENNGAAMSLGRCSTFLDIYLERDLQLNRLTEQEAQELIDQFVIKLRLVRQLRTPEYNELFAGDPNWITESIGGIGLDGRPLVTRTSFRFLHTLTNLGPAPEPNMTVLWSTQLPRSFKRYCSRLSIMTDSIQYENDDLMRPVYGDDYGIACCVSAMGIGKQMQYFGARCNLAKALLYAINGGVDEKTGKQVIKGIERIEDEVLDFDKVLERFHMVLMEVARVYVEAINIIHYMHDKYAYEAGLMALSDTSIDRLTAFGVAGLSVVADSLSAIKHARVKPVYADGIARDFNIEGQFPMYGNDDDRVDLLAVDVLRTFFAELKKHQLYRKASHTLSVLTISSNVVYGRKTGATPDGRKDGQPFAPGANPMHGRDARGALASLNTVAKLPYREVCKDGISNTFSIVPQALGADENSRIDNLTAILDGYFLQGGFHLNVNVLDKEKLVEAMEHPDKYPLLTIRVSGYAVRFNRLSREQQLEVIARTFHQKMAG